MDIKTKKLRIAKIEVEKLFGVYDYTLECFSNKPEDNLIILYGDNGTGKSTILHLISFLLSNKRRNGHKSQMANIEFKSFKLTFDTGDFILAYRKKQPSGFMGSFNIRYKINNFRDDFFLKAQRDDGEEWVIRCWADDSDEQFEKLMKILDETKILYISDNRKGLDEEEEQIPYDEFKNGYSRIRISRDKKEEEVESEIRNLKEWIIGRALAASKKGEEGTSDIYVKILRQLIYNQEYTSSVDSIEKLKFELFNLSQMANPYVKMGFLSDSDFNGLVYNLDKIGADKKELVNAILAPYIEMLSNKLTALNDLMRILSFLIDSLSEYFHEKIINFTVNDGFVIRHSKNGSVIAPHSLSSGEKQLLILFSKIIRRSSESSFIIIDEPEISLNIKWQRMLMDTLSFFVGESHAQFIIATHSFEILSRHMDNVVKLEDINHELY